MSSEGNPEGENDEKLDDGELDFPYLHLPPGATVHDFNEALNDMDGDDGLKLWTYVMEEVIDLLDDGKNIEFMDMEQDEKKAKRTTLSDFFEGYVDTLPFIFDGQKNVARVRSNAAAKIKDVLREPTPKEAAMALLREIFPGVNMDLPLPRNEEWVALAMRRLPFVDCILEAKKQGIPEECWKRNMFSIAQSRIATGNFRFVADYLRQTGVGTPEQCDAFERLADEPTR